MSPELEAKLSERYPTIFRDGFYGCECGDGWFDILDALCASIVALPSDSDLTVSQIKEKFGTLRFYAGPASETTDSLIEFAEIMSARTCEDCGNRGRLRCGAWLKTLCDPCNEKWGTGK